MAKVFFSYSHKDETARDELELHLKPLKREGVIESWHDRRIDAGDEFDATIRAQLEAADVILLLVSPFFIASDYCHDVEVRRAMERPEEGSARVIPVILEHSDWETAPFRKLLAVPKDGRPISKFPNRHEAFLEVAKSIRAAVPSKSAKPASPKSVAGTLREEAPTQSATHPRSSNLGIRHSFTDHDRDVFLEEGFEYIAKYFEASLAELQSRNIEITTRFRRIDQNRFTAFIYCSGKGIAECGIRLGDAHSKGILYSHSANSSTSWNESISVEANGTTLFLKMLGMSTFGSPRERELTYEGAAEELWSLLMRPLKTDGSISKELLCC